MALALKVPVFFVVTKVDICPEHILKQTVQVGCGNRRAVALTRTTRQHLFYCHKPARCQQLSYGRRPWGALGRCYQHRKVSRHQPQSDDSTGKRYT